MHEQGDQGHNGNNYKWARFIVGHILSAAAAIYEITQLSVCFDENLNDDDGGTLEEDDGVNLEEDESRALNYTLYSLVLCLFVDVVSAVVLPLIYRQPFDIKSVHKVPAYDTRQCCCGTCTVHFLAPFTWGVELLFAGLTSYLYSINSSCDGQGGEGLETYFLFSGVLSMFGGLFMLGVSALAIVCSCCTPNCMIECCTNARELNRKCFLTKGRYVEYWCILQGVLWSYRTGSLSVVEAIVVAVVAFSGVALADCAIAPDALDGCTLNCF